MGLVTLTAITFNVILCLSKKLRPNEEAKTTAREMSMIFLLHFLWCMKKIWEHVMSPFGIQPIFL